MIRPLGRSLILIFAPLLLVLTIACDDAGDNAGPIEDERAYFVDQSRDRIESIRNQIDDLDGRVAAVNPDSPSDLEEQLNEVKQELDDTEGQLAQLPGADDEEFDDLRAEIDRSLDSVERRLDELDSRT